MKTKRTIISLVLVLAMLLSWNTVPVPAQAAQEEQATELLCHVSVQAPYRAYYDHLCIPY